MYYDPSVTYRIPKKYDSNGNESGSYSTSFTNAYYNGFKPNLGSINLASNYRVSWWYKPTTSHSDNFNDNVPDYSYRQFSYHPAQEFSATATITNNNSTVTAKTAEGVTISIRRSNSTNCTATATGHTNLTCVRTNTNRYTAYLTNTPAYYYLFDKSLASCGNSVEDEECYRLVKVDSNSGINGADERENFAIWYSFYRNRALATMSAARLAFADLSPSARLTWQSLNACKSLNSNSKCNDNRFREFGSAQRGRFFSWLDTLDFNSGTPLREALGRAGEFLKTETAWLKHPNDTSKTNNSENTYACRPSYHVLMTDGIWNGNNGSPSDTFKSDNASFKLPDGKTFSSTQTPYGDQTNNTLADLAMHYWATDLSKLDNKLSPFMPIDTKNETNDYWDPRNDPATWQHMVNFTMGLGLSNALQEADLRWDEEKGTFGGEGYTNLANGTKAWPSFNINSDDPKKVYDLWHAAINSRGEFFSVDSPDTMVQAFEDILSRIAERKSTAARPAISSGLVIGDTTTSVSYQTTYASDENWSGDLKRFSKKLVKNDDDQYVIENTQDWSAQKKLPTPGGRTIKISDENGAGTSKLKDFTISNAGNPETKGTLAHALNVNPEVAGESADGRWQERLSYLRGDRGKEGSDAADFRQRTAVLGDLYGSSPVVVSGARYLEGFANRLEGHIGADGAVVPGDSSYSAFLTKINGTEEGTAKRTGRVYVGGNDGMLHGFNTETGVEEFAFIPSAVFDKLNKLTGKNYSHQFYVDGSPVVADIYDHDSKRWRTILVGTLRAGGKALFALDVTAPGNEQLLWEFDASDIEDEDAVKPGYSFPTPTIARLHNGRWAVVTGNGYENGASDGKAALYVIDAVTGELTKSLEVSGASGTTNGLSSPVLADYNADGVADYAYAGDLQGNLWRFDLLGPNANPDRDLAEGGIYGDKNGNADSFKVSYGGKPMFTAASSKDAAAQSITAAPTLIRHPSRMGYLVIFGTGKFFEAEDKDGVKTHAQSIYGIWDTKTRAESTSAFTIQRTDDEASGHLVKQTIIEQLTGTYTQGGTNPARTISNKPVQWTTSNADGVVSINKYGWYLDLAVNEDEFEGEMLIEKMSTLGQTIFFQTLVPNDDPCADGASNWTYALNPFTGGKTLFHAFDLRHVDSNNVVHVVSGIKQDGEGGITISQNPDSGFEACTGLVCQTIYPDPSSIGRQSWRVIGN
ncbi:pilus assembly protein [Stutzerimonas nitrititolerans]|uniref:pilus assembly protein n=1 Tax=Stutzerimonas nitrititolerans TaxID=2482751 RepID=UPI0028AD5DFC|nr:PilC/PilY family type IV pilus protein [Stutzerimonas nitrititolerans]